MARPRAQAQGSPGVAWLRALDRGSLSRALIIRVAALVAVVAILLDAAGIMVSRTLTMRTLDQQLTVNLRTMGPSGGQGQLGLGGAGSWATNGLEVVLSSRSGKPVGDGVVAVNQQLMALSADQIAVLRQAVPVAPSGRGCDTIGIASVDVPGLGDYRVARCVNGPMGTERILGLSLDSVRAAGRALLVAETLVTVGAVLLVALAVATVVRMTLRPLTRLAQTASAVAHTPLDRGEVSLPTRVSAEDANPASEVGRVGLAFNTMLDNVEHALASRQRSETQVRQFVADASHELRNPLAAIRGYAELAQRQIADLPEDVGFSVGRIDAESKRMTKLVENLLLLARLDNGQRPDFAPVDAVEVVANAVSDAQVTGPDHVWTLRVPDDTLMVWADPFQLHQVVANLLANARKHTPPGTPVEAAVSRSADGAQAVITITDEGPGIDPTVVGHVFERFARADVARTHDDEGSSGLGLAIVAAVVAAHGGQVGVDSRPGWTRFTVTWPAYRMDLVPGTGVPSQT